jgi:hypothetical protein
MYLHFWVILNSKGAAERLRKRCSFTKTSWINEGAWPLKRLHFIPEKLLLAAVKANFSCLRLKIQYTRGDPILLHLRQSMKWIHLIARTFWQCPAESYNSFRAFLWIWLKLTREKLCGTGHTRGSINCLVKEIVSFYDVENFITLQTCAVISGSLLPWHGASSSCGWKNGPPDMEGSCEYIK